MSSFLDELRVVRRAPVAVFHEFRLAYCKDESSVHAFVEGLGDKEYLTPAIRNRTRDAGVRFYLCDGKTGVLAALSSFEAEFPNQPRVLFFVDRDYADQIGFSHPASPNLYVTDNYSIESEVASREALKFILSELVHLDQSDTVTQIILDQYENIHKSFCRRMRRFSALTICESRANTKINLNNVNLSHVFSIKADFTLQMIGQPVVRFATMCGMPTGAVDPKALAIELKATWLAKRKRWLRGKYDLWIFLKFANAIWIHLAALPGETGRRYRQTLTLTDQNVFQLVAGRIPYPASLLRFLAAALP